MVAMSVGQVAWLRCKRAFLQPEPVRELRRQFNDSVDDHSNMSAHRNRVRFMIPHDFVHIGKRLAGNATGLRE